VSDDDAENFVKIFTMLSKGEIAKLIKQHREAPHLRLLQKALAEKVTILTNGEKEYKSAFDASQILFGKGTTELLKTIDENTFMDVFEGVPQFIVSQKELEEGLNLPDLLTVKTSIFSSRGELRRLIQGGGLSLNKEKINHPDFVVTKGHLINEKYILIQKGKKTYFLIRVNQ
jgi:tyrosyl-tRNA synthetase